MGLFSFFKRRKKNNEWISKLPEKPDDECLDVEKCLETFPEMESRVMRRTISACCHLNLDCFDCPLEDYCKREAYIWELEDIEVKRLCAILYELECFDYYSSLILSKEREKRAIESYCNNTDCKDCIMKNRARCDFEHMCDRKEIHHLYMAIYAGEIEEARGYLENCSRIPADELIVEIPNKTNKK